MCSIDLLFTFVKWPILKYTYVLNDKENQGMGMMPITSYSDLKYYRLVLLTKSYF